MQFESISKVIASPSISLPKMLTKTSLDSFYHVLHDIPKDNLEHGNIQEVTNLEYREHIDFTQNIPHYHYIHDKVQRNLESYRGYSIKYKMYLPKNMVTIHMYLPCAKSQMKSAMAKCSRDVHLIYLWMMLVQQHVRHSCSKVMNIHIIFSSLKKTLGKSNTEMDAYHVNSAFTTSCKEETDIVIYRNEEWLKVLIHETFHSLGLDFSSLSYDEEAEIGTLFSVQSSEKVRLYEGYCEYWAEVMHIVIMSYMDTKTKKDYLQCFDFMMRRQLQFSVFQMVKILKHHEMTYHDMTSRRETFREKTHILSYYIVKSLLLFFSASFENWCKRHNHTLFQFQQEETKIMEFIRFISKHYRATEFLQYVRKMELYISKREKTFPHELMRTMRMTLL